MEAWTYQDPKREEELKHSFFPREPRQRELSFQIWEKNASYVTIPSVTHERKLAIHFFHRNMARSKMYNWQIYFFQNIKYQRHTALNLQ